MAGWLRRHWPLCTLGAAMFVGVLARMGTIDEVVAGDWPHAFSEDDHYHLRRIVFALRNGVMLERDAFMSFPSGAWSWWPDGFDGLLVWLVRLTAGAAATTPTVTVVASLAIPWLSIASLPLVYALGVRMRSPAAGALAAAVVALLPAHGFAGLAGVVDHHCLEPVLSLAPLLALAAALTAASPRRAAAWGALAGALLGATLYVWSGAPLLDVVVFGALGLTLLGTPRERWPARAAALAGFAPALVLVTAHAVWATPLGRAGAYVTFIISRFHLVFTLALVAELALLLVIVRQLRGVARQLACLVAVDALAALGVALALGYGRAELGELTAFVRSQGIVAWIEETQPAWANLGETLSYLSPLALPLPLFVAWEVRQALRARVEAPGRALLHVAGAQFLLLTALQLRHKIHWAAFAALSGIALGAHAHRWLARRQRPATAALLLTLAALAVMYRPMTWMRDATLGRAGTRAGLAACDFLRARTPAPAPPYAADARPAWSVLGAWDIGKTIAGVCERPSLGSADAYGEQLAGVLDSMRFYTTDDAELGMRLLDTYRVRYLLLTPQALKHWQASVAMLGLPAREWFDANGALRAQRFTAALFARLYYADGNAARTSGGTRAALRELRLVHETDGVSPAKVYERVAGVWLTAQLRPREPVLIEAALRSDAGRRFTYTDVATADDSGLLRVRFPYLGRVEARTPSARLTATVRADDRELVLR